MNRLIAGGFALTGRWELNAPFVRLIGKPPVQPGVYAYAVDGIVHYVGSAQGGLAKRLRQYEYRMRLRATTRRGQITEALKSGLEVAVLTIVFPEPLRWNGLPVDLIAGLEEGLIREWQPLWNVRGLGALRKAKPMAALTHPAEPEPT
jgi:hypothetical protein